MSDYHFLNMIKQQAAMLGSLRTDTRVGEVTSVDTKNYCVKALVQPDNAESGWLPVTTLWSGNDWGLFAIPSIGDQVKIDFFMGALDVGIVTGVIANNKKAPLDAPVGEFWLVHASGSSLKFTNDGSVALVTNKDLAASVGGNAQLTITGSTTATLNGGLTGNVTGNVNLTVSGNVVGQAAAWQFTGPTEIVGNLTVTGGIAGGTGGSAGTMTYNGAITATGDIAGNGISLDTHTHPDPQGGSTGQPQ